MKTRVVGLIIVIITMLCELCTSAHDTYFDGKYINIKAVEFTSGGEKITSLPASGEVTATVTVKKSKRQQDIQNLNVVAALYKDDKLVNFQVKEYLLENYYSEKADISVDTDGATRLCVYVCDNLEEGRPFAAKAVLGLQECSIKTITVNGEKLEDFSEDNLSYDVIIPAGVLAYPEITPVITDSGVRCEIINNGSFPLENSETAVTEITVMNPNGKNKTYTINMTQEAAEIYNLKVVNEVNENEEIVDKLAGVVSGIKDVSFIEEPQNPIKMSTNSATGEDMTEGYGHNNHEGIPMFYDRGAYPLAFLPDELENSYMIQAKMDFHNGRGSYINFDINRSATVYVSAVNGSELISEGYVQDKNMDVSWISCNEDKGRLYRYDVYKKHYDVEIDTSVTVEVPHGGINAFVVFDKSSTVSDARLMPANGEQISLPVINVRNAQYRDPMDPEYNEGIENYLYATKVVADKMDDKYYFADEFPEELTGSVAIAVPDRFRKYNSDVNNTEFISFDLSETADVYIVYDAAFDSIPWMQDEGYEDVSDSINSIKYVYGAENIEYSKNAYKKTYDVLPGETIKVNIGGFPKTENSSKVPLMIFVKKR